MLKHITKKQLAWLRQKFKELVAAPPLPFAKVTPSVLPKRPGVYLITLRRNKKEEPYYVGRTKNLRQRLYDNHLMGPVSNARLKKHLISAKECAGVKEAKEFIKNNCWVRWVEQDGFRERGALEGYATGLLFPKHGIYEEH